jgi:chemotaxis protein MotB
MMVAFVMFAVLYSYVLSHRDIGEALRKPPESIPAKSPIKETFKLPAAQNPVLNEGKKTETGDNLSMEEFYETLQSTINVSNLDDVSVALGQNRVIKVTVGEPMLFDLGRAKLKPDAIAFLRKLSEKIRKTRFKIIVEGHADSFPIHNEAFPTNWELSAIRAVKVVRFLVEDAGLEPERFSIAGYSMYRPLVPNSSTRNKAMNRRVEMVITGEKIE